MKNLKLQLIPSCWRSMKQKEKLEQLLYNNSMRKVILNTELSGKQ